jgi:hypothetical protein
MNTLYLGIRFVLFHSIWYENVSRYLQMQGVCEKLSMLAIDLCIKIFGVTYYHIWAYECIRAGWADDLISRWLLPTFWLVLWSINEINTEYVETHRKPGLHRSWGCLICLPVTYRYWSPAQRVKKFILHNVFTKQHLVRFDLVCLSYSYMRGRKLVGTNLTYCQCYDVWLNGNIECPTSSDYLCATKKWHWMVMCCRHPLRGLAIMLPWQSCSRWDTLFRDMLFTWVGQNKA